MDRIGEIWGGQAGLARTFWVYGVAVSVLLKSVAVLAVGLTGARQGFAAFFLALLLFSVLYQVFISVAVWRSANAFRGYPGWAFAAKAMVLLGLAQTVFALGGQAWR